MGAKSVWLDIKTPEQLADMAQEYMQLKDDLRKVVERMEAVPSFSKHYRASMIWAKEVKKLLGGE